MKKLRFVELISNIFKKLWRPNFEKTVNIR